MDYWNRYFNNDLNDKWFMGLANAADVDGLDEFGVSTTWIQKENAAGFRCGQIKFGILAVVIEQ